MRVILGLDVGSRMTKAVALEATGAAGAPRVLGRATCLTHFDLDGAARRAASEALERAGAASDEPAYLAATGCGRYQVEGRHIQITEITCHARGAASLLPGVATVLDVGAQNARAIRVLPSGRVAAFRMNDKCASGAGRFIERVARALEIGLEEVGPLALRAARPCAISSICAVLAESEVINHVTNGESIPDILQGTHESIADRLASLVRQVGVVEPLALTGGVSKNPAMVRALEQKLGVPIQVFADSEYAGAIGAALLGGQRLVRNAPAATG